MADVNCYVCNKRTREHITNGGAAFRWCPHCSIAMKFPLSSQKYDKDYMESHSIFGNLADYMHSMSHDFNLMDMFWQINHKCGRALDFGCNSGAGLKHLADRNFDVYGVDVNQHALSKCKELGFQNVFNKLDDVKDEMFNVIVSRETIEHVSKPFEVLAWFAEHLLPDGLLYIQTPQPRIGGEVNHDTTYCDQHSFVLPVESIALFLRDYNMRVIHALETKEGCGVLMMVKGE